MSRFYYIPVGSRRTVGDITCPTSASSSVCYYSHTGPTKFSVLLDMVKGLQTDIKKVQENQAGRRAPQTRDNPAKSLPLTCWGCRSEGHVKQDCSHRKSVSMNTHSLQ